MVGEDIGVVVDIEHSMKTKQNTVDVGGGTIRAKEFGNGGC